MVSQAALRYLSSPSVFGWGGESEFLRRLICAPFTLRSFAGITLRKVEKNEQKEKERSTAFHDVASILARRVAIELSESEDSDSDEDSECWVEPTETSA